MFTVEIRINGTLINHIYGKNTTNPRSPEDLDEYTYEIYEPEVKEIKTGKVKHSRADGIIPLISHILKDSL